MSEDCHNSENIPDFDPFNVEALRAMLAEKDYSAVGPESTPPFMTSEECELRSQEISEADIIFAHALGVRL